MDGYGFPGILLLGISVNRTGNPLPYVDVEGFRRPSGIVDYLNEKLDLTVGGHHFICDRSWALAVDAARSGI